MPPSLLKFLPLSDQSFISVSVFFLLFAPSVLSLPLASVKIDDAVQHELLSEAVYQLVNEAIEESVRKSSNVAPTGEITKQDEKSLEEQSQDENRQKETDAKAEAAAKKERHKAELRADKLIAKLYQLSDQRLLNKEIFSEGLASSFAQVRTAATIGLGRIGGANAAELLKAKIRDSDESVRQHMALALGISNSQSATSWLEEWLAKEKSLPVQQEILLALGNLGGELAFGLLTKSLGSSELAGSSAQALGLLASWHEPDQYSFDTLDYEMILLKSTMDFPAALTHAFLLTRVPSSQQRVAENRLVETISRAKSDLVRALLIKSWGRRSDKSSYELILPYLQSQSEAVQVESIRAVADGVDNPTVFTELRRLLKHSRPAVVSLAFENLLKADNSHALAEFIEAALAGKDSYNQLLALRWLAIKNSDRAVNLIADFPLNSPRYSMVQAIKILGKSQSSKAHSLLEKWSKHSDSFVARAASVELKEIHPTDKKNNRNTPKFINAYRLSQKRVEVVTNRGAFMIQLSANALYTSSNFAELVQKKFYDGTLFSRIIPNFVAQGGEHNGDGSGSVGYQIREEINLLSHLPGTVGMATNGKDTGGAQFFVNLSPNFHLDRRYTVFGRIIKGWPVIQQLRMGDWIVSARLVN